MPSQFIVGSGNLAKNLTLILIVFKTNKILYTLLFQVLNFFKLVKFLSYNKLHIKSLIYYYHFDKNIRIH